MSLLVGKVTNPAYSNPYKEWYVDHPWFSTRVEGSLVLDTGFIEHNFFTEELCKRKYRVYGLDRGNWDYRWKSELFTWVAQEICDPLPFEDEFFDCIVSPSLIEHLGLGHYGDKILDNGDAIAVKEFHRVLKVGGIMLVQLPFCAESRIVMSSKGRPFYRTYTKGTLETLFGGFSVEEKSYAARKPVNWVEVGEDEANLVNYSIGLTPCIVRAKVRRVA